jgi:hypothetical protein
MGILYSNLVHVTRQTEIYPSTYSRLIDVFEEWLIFQIACLRFAILNCNPHQQTISLHLETWIEGMF